MRYLLIFMLLVAIFVLGRKCSPFSFGVNVKGEGPVQSETRSVNGFHGIDQRMSGDVEVKTGTDYSVVVHAQQNVLPKIKTEVEDGLLVIYVDGGIWTSGDIRVEVTAPAIDDLRLKGSGSIKMLTPMQAASAHFSISGSGDIQAEQLQAEATQAEVTGSGNIDLGGNTRAFTGRIAGSGDIEAKDLATDSLDVHISGSGNMYCRVQRALTGKISGSGDVVCEGRPTVNVKVSGSGDVSTN